MTKKASALDEPKGDQMENEGRFTKAQIWTIAVTILVVFIGTGLNLLVKKWYGPDLRYEENPYYILKGQAVTSCLVKNYGRSSVNEVRISVEFLSKILDIQISPEFGGKIVENGVGQQNAVIELERIVPNDEVTIFFALERSQGESIVKHIASKEMLGKTGQSVLSDPSILLNIFNLCWAALLVFFVVKQLIIVKKEKSYLKEIKQLNKEAKQLNREVKDNAEKAIEKAQDLEKEIIREAKDRAEKIIGIIEKYNGQPEQVIDKTTSGIVESDGDLEDRERNEPGQDN